MTDNLRGTGRTTRMLEEAIRANSRPAVMVVVAVFELKDSIKKTLTRLSFDNTIIVNSYTEILRQNPHFDPHNPHVEGYVGKIFVDHGVIELYDKQKEEGKKEALKSAIKEKISKWNYSLEWLQDFNNLLDLNGPSL